MSYPARAEGLVNMIKKEQESCARDTGKEDERSDVIPNVSSFSLVAWPNSRQNRFQQVEREREREREREGGGRGATSPTHDVLISSSNELGLLFGASGAS